MSGDRSTASLEAAIDAGKIPHWVALLIAIGFVGYITLALPIAAVAGFSGGSRRLR